MNLVEVILKEHTTAMKNRVTNYVGSNPRRFKELVNLFLKGPYRVTQRSSWPIAECVEKHPELVKPHLKTILDNLNKPALHDSVKRNSIRLLQFIQIPKALQGKVADRCIGYLSDHKETVAVKVYSMLVLEQLVKSEPALSNEVRIIIEDQMPYQTPAFRSRGAKIIKALTPKS